MNLNIQPADLQLLMYTLFFFAGVYGLACIAEWLLEIRRKKNQKGEYYGI